MSEFDMPTFWLTLMFCENTQSAKIFYYNSRITLLSMEWWNHARKNTKLTVLLDTKIYVRMPKRTSKKFNCFDKNMIDHSSGVEAS